MVRRDGGFDAADIRSHGWELRRKRPGRERGERQQRGDTRRRWYNGHGHSTLGVLRSRRRRRLLDQPDRATGSTDHGGRITLRGLAALQDLDDDRPFVVTRNEKDYVAGAVQARERERDARHRRLDGSGSFDRTRPLRSLAQHWRAGKQRGRVAVGPDAEKYGGDRRWLRIAAPKHVPERLVVRVGRVANRPRIRRDGM